MVLEVNVGAYLLLSALLMAQMGALLWAAGAVAGLRAPGGRIVLGAAAGTAYAVLVDLASFGVWQAPFLRDWPWVIAISAGVFLLTYFPRPWRQALHALAAYYFLAMLGAGVAYTGYNLGARGWIPPVLATAVILAAAELGWGVVQRWLWDRVLYLPLEIELLDRKVQTTALLDTGNRLVDPLTRRPVIVLGSELRPALLPPETLAAMESAGDDAAACLSLLAHTPLASRLHLVPYATVGEENGLLLAVRVDRVRLVGLGGGEVAGRALIAFHRQPLDPQGGYGALVPPALLRGALAQASRRAGRLVIGAELGAGSLPTKLGG